jgi:hypothetical protein
MGMYDLPFDLPKEVIIERVENYETLMLTINKIKLNHSILYELCNKYVRHLCVTCPESVPSDEFGKHRYCRGCGVLEYYKLLLDIKQEE